MTLGHIIRLLGDRHRDVQSLLPWYVTGQLETSERAQVEAHLHQCPECQTDLDFERRLDAEIVALPVEVEHGWALLRRRMALDPPRRGRGTIRRWLAPARGKISAATARPARTDPAWRMAAPWKGWAAVATMVLLLVGGVAALQSVRPRYHALGAPPAAADGNVVVIFRPETRERDLRQALQASHARLVDGPTAADAYVLHVPAADRAAAVARLRGRADIVLAEPVDSGETP